MRAKAAYARITSEASARQYYVTMLNANEAKVLKKNKQHVQKYCENTARYARTTEAGSL